MIFRADSVSQAGRFLRKIVEMQSFSVREELLDCFHLPEFTFIVQRLHLSNLAALFHGIEMRLLLMVCFVIVLVGKNSYELEWKVTGKSAVMTILLLVWSIMSLAGVSVFLYFNF